MTIAYINSGISGADPSPSNVAVTPGAIGRFAILGYQPDSSANPTSFGAVELGGVPMVPQPLLSAGNGAGRAIEAFMLLATIPATALNAVMNWSGGGPSNNSICGIYGADLPLAIVDQDKIESDSLSSLTLQMNTQPGDKIVIQHTTNNGAVLLVSDTNAVKRNEINNSGWYTLWDQDAGAGDTTDVEIHWDGSAIASSMTATVLREVTPPITAAHGDQDVAYGEDPAFTNGNVNGANLKAGAISIPLTLGVSSTNSAPTFNLDDFTTFLRDNPWFPFSGTQLVIEITSDDVGDTAVTRNITLTLPANFALVTLDAVVNTNASAFYQSSGYDGPDFTPEDGAQMVYDNRFNTAVAVDGTLTTDRNGTEIKAWIYLPTQELLIFYPFSAPATEVITINGSPTTLEPSTQYVAAVVGSTSVCDGGQTFNSGTGHDVTIDSADLNSITFTTNASLPAGSPVQFKFNLPSA